MRIIRGKYGRRRFDVPKNITARPTTDFARENLFNVIENIENIETKRVCDLFAGTGAISWEFVSRGASLVTAVEQAPVQCAFIREVKEKLSDKTLQLFRGDVFRFIARDTAGYDIVFADPPYNHPRFAEIPELILASSLVASGSLLIVEHNKNHDFSRISGFFRHLVYGSVNFSLFRKADCKTDCKNERHSADGFQGNGTVSDDSIV